MGLRQLAKMGAHPADFFRRRPPEMPFELATELRGADVADGCCSSCYRAGFSGHQEPRLMEAHRLDVAERVEPVVRGTGCGMTGRSFRLRRPGLDRDGFSIGAPYEGERAYDARAPGAKCGDQLRRLSASENSIVEFPE